MRLHQNDTESVQVREDGEGPWTKPWVIIYNVNQLSMPE
jgi:hypothetical protein